MSCETTLSETSPEARDQVSSPPVMLALSLVWSADEPSRAGEVVILPPGAPGPSGILGRGGGTEADPHPRLGLKRDRPGRILPAPALASLKVSRVQLRLRALGGEAIEVENLGRCKLLHNGVERAECRLAVGDTLEVGGQLVFLCVRRPAWLPGPMLDDGFPFGEADAHGLVGESPALWELRRRIAFVGPRPGHVLVRGESGTGKELVARALHAMSSRAGRTLVARNAATLPEGIMDAELFGNLRNYPNPGMAERPGLVGEADGSTFFLDEFGEISPALQAHLLRVLDSGEYQRLGEARSRRSDFRLVAATNRPDGAIKPDLLARLVFRVETPSLNDRREDVPLIAVHVLRRMAKEDPSIAARFFSDGRPRLSPSLIRMLVQHPFATNVRELEALLWQALAESRGDVLEAAPHARGRGAPADERGARSSSVLAPVSAPGALTPAAIQACLDAHNGVIEDAWRPLGLSSRHALARLIRKHGLELRRKPG
jgi:two-component system nitrogen regulation response regulator GlnG/two-component system response regulator HydG